MIVETIKINTSDKQSMHDITETIKQVIKKQGFIDGMITVFTPHTTAGITINENADIDVQKDMMFGLNKLIPNRPEYQHFEGNTDAHIKSSLIGVSETLIVQSGKLLLGTWQSVYLFEFDGPRQRNVYISLHS